MKILKQELEDIIKREEESLESSTNSNIKVGILYNLIFIKYKNQLTKNKLSFYIDIKLLINNYVELVKTNDFGYDLFCKEKILRVISYLTLNEQHSILNYLFSVLSREFPEIEKEWVQNEINQVQLKKYIEEKNIQNLPYAILLFSSLSLSKLIITLVILVMIVITILLPAPYNWMEIFKISYIQYSESFFVNHVLNVISLFGGINNGCEIIALNSLGLFVQITSKVMFVLLIVNFVYKKISDKISVG